MQTTKLTLSEIYGLESELFGLTSPQTNEVLAKGLLSQNLTLKNRYWLSRLGDSIQAEKKAVDTLRDELIKELGTSDENGNFSLQPSIEGQVNPNFVKFQEELSSLLKEEKEISHAIFTLEQFENLETTEHYPVFLKLLSVEETN
jgi:hypothetical protein